MNICLLQYAGKCIPEANGPTDYRQTAICGKRELQVTVITRFKQVTLRNSRTSILSDSKLRRNDPSLCRILQLNSNRNQALCTTHPAGRRSLDDAGRPRERSTACWCRRQSKQSANAVIPRWPSAGANCWKRFAFPVNESILELAQLLVVPGAIPKKAGPDGVHIAAAAVEECEFLLTWNFRHLANARIRREVERILAKHGYTKTTICTPEELV